MGLSQAIYFGPVLTGKSKVVNVPVEIWTCSVVNCNQHKANVRKRTSHKGSYCNVCGQKCTNVIIQVPNFAIRDFDPEEKYANELEMELCEKTGIFLFRMSIDFSREYHTFNSEFEDDLSEVNIQWEINWFSQQFAEAIDEIKKFSESIDIRWKIISYLT